MILLSSNGAGSILLLVGYIAIFAAIMYFAAIRPQKKLQQKSLLKTRRRLKKNLKTVAKQSTLKLFQETLTSTKVMTTSLKVRLFRFRKAGAIRLT